MTEENNKHTLKIFLLFTIPLILSGMLQQVFNWVDAFIVGRFVGEQALAGIGIITAIYNLFITIIVGFTSGISVLSAQQYGRGEKEKIKKTLAVYSVLLGVVFIIISTLGILFTDKILVIMDTPEKLFLDAKIYMQIMLLAIPFLAVYNTYSAVLRSMGNSRAPFIAVIVSSIANAILDLVLVVGFGLGVMGAALATAISQMAMSIFIVIYTTVKYPSLRFSFSELSNCKDSLIKGGEFGVPPAIQSGVSSVGSVFLQRFMNGFGAQTVAAITTAYRVDLVLLLPIVNFGTGISTLVAQNIGAGDYKQAKNVFKLGIVLMAIFSILMTMVIFLFGEDLIAMFGLTEESVEIGKKFFRRIAAFYLVDGLSMAIRGYLEGTGDMVFSGVAGILSLIVRIICSYVFIGVFDNMVVAYAEGFSWVFLLLVFTLRYFRKSRDMQLNLTKKVK